MNKKVLYLAGIMLLKASFSFAQVDLTKDLVMYLPFNGNANDISGKANHGTVYGAKLTTDRNGHANAAYLFDKNSYIEVTDSPSLSPQIFTLCATVYPQGFYDGQYYVNHIVGKNDLFFTNGHYSMQYDPLYLDVDPADPVSTSSGMKQDTINQTFSGYCYNAYPTGGYFNYTPKVVKNNWYCLTMTASLDSIKFYIDGALKYTYPRAGTQGVNTNNLRIGRIAHTTYPYCFIGKIDEVRLYKRALSAVEVNAYCSYDPLGVPTTSSDAIKDLLLAPNPAQNSVTVSYALKEKSAAVLEVRDMIGRIIIKQDLPSATGAQSHTIDMSSLSKGNYVLSISVDGMTSSRQFTKQ